MEILDCYSSLSGGVYTEHQKFTVVHGYEHTQKYPLPFLASIEEYSIKETLSKVKFKAADR